MVQTQLEDYGEGLHFSPNGRMLVCAHTKTDISLWRVTENLEHLYSFSSGLKRLYGTALSQDGTRLAVVGEGLLRVWQLSPQTREAVLAMEQKFTDGYLSAAVFSPDETRILTAGTAEALYIVSLQTNTIEQDTGPGTNEDADDGFWLRERTSSLIFHPDGKTLLATSSSQGGSAVLFCELRFDQESYFLSERNDLTIRLPADVLLPATFSRDGRFFAFSDWDLHLYQFPSQQRVASFGTNGRQYLGPLPDRGSANVEAVWSNAVFTPDGQILICGSPAGSIFVWDVPSGNLRQTLTGHDGGVLALALNPTGTRLASSGHDKTLRLWQIPV